MEGGGERLAKEKPVNFTGVYLDYQFDGNTWSSAARGNESVQVNGISCSKLIWGNLRRTFFLQNIVFPSWLHSDIITILMRNATKGNYLLDMHDFLRF